MIHIAFARGHRYDERAYGRLPYVVCQAEVSEQEAYRLSKSKEYDALMRTKPTTNLRGREVAIGDERISRIRHDLCHTRCQEYRRRGCSVSKFVALQHMHPPTAELDIQLLQVCRRIYDEANPVFWSSTTWSFDDVLMLAKFMESRNTFQKACMRSLHVDGDGSSLINYFQLWQRKSMLQGFTALETLHFEISRDYIESPIRYDGALFSDMWKSFRYLPLKNVTVILNGIEVVNKSVHPPLWRTATHDERVKLAEIMEVKLLE
jgi:hypothetical protein